MTSTVSLTVKVASQLLYYSPSNRSAQQNGENDEHVDQVGDSVEERSNDRDMINSTTATNSFQV